MPTRVLITGGAGLLGSALARSFANTAHVVTTTRRPRSGAELIADLRDADAVAELFDISAPEVVVHTAANASVTACQRDLVDANESNVLATKNVANACRRAGIRLIHISTDHVFSEGMCVESTIPAPLQVYGETKLMAEGIVGSHANSLIIRLPLLYADAESETKTSVVNNLLRSARDGLMPALDDVFVRYPTHVDDVASWITTVAQTALSGVVHVSASEGLTRLGMARCIAEYSALCEIQVTAMNDLDDILHPVDVFLASERLLYAAEPHLRTFSQYVSTHYVTISQEGSPE